MAGSKNHDFHILDPDYLPFMASMSAVLMTSGGVMTMHPEWAGTSGKYVLLLGFMGVIASMFLWWTKVVRESKQGHHTPVVQLHLRYGMITFIASEVMFFVGWFWAFFDFSLFPNALSEVTGGQFPSKAIEAVMNPFDLPLLNTMILLCSGTTITWAHHSLIHGDRDGLKKGLWATIALGIVFSAVQAYEYAHAPFDFGGNTYSSAFYMATGFHGFHVLVGTIFLIVCLKRAYNGDFTPKQHFGFEAAAWYWHFVDVVWLFLFVAVYVWGGWGHPVH